MNDLKELLDNGRINEYFHDLLGRRAQIISPQRLGNLIEQAQAMTEAGVCSDEDHCIFSLIMMHTRPIAQDIIGGKIPEEKLAQISDIIFKNRAKRPIDNITNFYKAVYNAVKEAKLSMKKMAYPQSYLGMYVYPSYNISKWMNSVKEIYIMSQKHNIDLKHAFDKVTQGWDEREKQDFSYWMRFYAANEHEKYKTAQMKYYAPAVTDDQSEGRGYFVPMYDTQDLRAAVPGIAAPVMPNMNGVGGASQEDINKEQEQSRLNEERKVQMSNLRNKIIGRLTSAEKLLSADDGRDLAGSELARLLEGLHALKRNVLSLQVSAKTANDLIIREANRMRNEGFVKSANVLNIIAQDPFAGLAPPGGEAGAEMPMPGAEVPGAEAPENPEDSPSAMEMFKERLREGLQGADNIYNKFEEEKKSMAPAAVPTAPVPDAQTEVGPVDIPPEQSAGEVPEAKASDDEEAAIIVFAQDVAPAPVPERAPAPPAPGEETEIEVEDKPSHSDITVQDSFDAALQNITAEDVIRRLENLATIFKHREIARELSIVDMMMDKLGIAAYFPNLAEAMQKALEANQYSLTRIEDILNKVRGVAIGQSTLDLTPTEKKLSPESDKLRSGLEQVEQKEKEKKEMREKRREEKEKAQVEAPVAAPEAEKATQELNAPARVERATPTPIR